MPKARKTFYADDAVHKHLDAMPEHARSSWINQVLMERIAKEKSKSSGSELADFAAWLEKQNAGKDTLEADVLSILKDFFAARKKK